jgi:Ring finger domain
MMVGMLIFLILGLLKFLLILFIVFFVIYVIVYRRLKRRSERSMSLLVINSLSRVKFSALLNQGEPDEECVICFNEYKDEDIVSRLDCNQKHMFHEECLRSWIS